MENEKDILEPEVTREMESAGAEIIMDNRRDTDSYSLAKMVYIAMNECASRKSRRSRRGNRLTVTA
jgi:hypothetical protein